MYHTDIDKRAFDKKRPTSRLGVNNRSYDIDRKAAIIELCLGAKEYLYIAHS